MALYSVRSERAFCEELEYNLLCCWFLDMNLMERSFDATVFIKNRARLLAHDAGRALFDEVVWAADQEGLLSDEHFSVDGILIEAAASPGASGPRPGHRPHPRTTIPATRRWISGKSAAATRRTPAPRTPRHGCCARGGARKPGWPFWAMP
uniref:IS4 family transposase n=1 Tax=uncultured marine bacterium 1k6 TaxID=662658 RepID=D2DIP3_9BACT|nr:IS4 family transposase [uncultured marine bacterium 1k6]